MQSLRRQPPPRGCVLKLITSKSINNPKQAAASARLCVETSPVIGVTRDEFAAASARLCVETWILKSKTVPSGAAASARLCVETVAEKKEQRKKKAAASARLCVETRLIGTTTSMCIVQPPPRGCVLKRPNVRNWSLLFFAAASARLCVETFNFSAFWSWLVQPPSGGCVLKHS